MKCPKCNADNPDTLKFCGECGTQLPSFESVEVTETIETPKEELTAGSTFAGRYQIVEELGRGGMGRVYRVLDKELKEEVALKLIKPEIAKDKKTIERFKNELKIARRISHRNVGRMYELMEAGSLHFITMEYIPGQDLRGLIRQTGQLTTGKAISIAREICEGLAEAHRQGVIHRDLKPSNIIIDKEGNPRILDFGIARSVEARGITGAGVMIGTPEYMSPEQVEGRETDKRSDIYSLGIILYEMLTGKVPFEGDTPFTVGVKHKSEIPKDPKELNPQIQDDLSGLVMKCLEKEEENRFQNAGEVRSELERIEQGLPTADRFVPKRKPLTSREITVQFNIKRYLIPIFAFFVIAAVALLLWHPWSVRKPAPIPSDKLSLAVLYFENNSGNVNLDNWRDGLSELLTTDLRQSKYLHVLNGNTVYEILERLNLLEKEKYSASDLMNVGVEGGVSHILLGSFITAEERFMIFVSLIEANTGETIEQLREGGPGEGSILESVDRITQKVKSALALTSEQIASDFDKEAAEITTGSLEAYKFYAEGRKHHFNRNFPASIELMKKAIALDPEFAMAYYSLAQSYFFGQRSEAIKNIMRAFELTEKTERISERERLLIQGVYYAASERTHDKALGALTRLLQIYPEDQEGNSMLGLIYERRGDQKKALGRLEAAYKYHKNLRNIGNLVRAYKDNTQYEKAEKICKDWISHIEDIAGIHNNLASIYLTQGRYDLAFAEAEKAFLIDPTNLYTALLKGDVSLVRGNLQEAEEEYKRLHKFNGAWHNLLKGRLAAVYLSQGKILKAADTIKDQPGSPVGIYVSIRQRRTDDSLKVLENLLQKKYDFEEIVLKRPNLWWKGIILAETGAIEEAEGVAEELKNLVPENTSKRTMWHYLHLNGLIEMKKGNFSAAVDGLEKSNSLIAPNSDDHAFYLDPLAYAFYLSGDFEKAQDQYEKITHLTTGRLSYGDIYAKAFYMLGKIHEEKRDTAKAIEYYKKFLDLWKDADPGIAEVEDARKRLTGLKAQ